MKINAGRLIFAIQAAFLGVNAFVVIAPQALWAGELAFWPRFPCEAQKLLRECDIKQDCSCSRLPWCHIDFSTNAPGEDACRALEAIACIEERSDVAISRASPVSSGATGCEQDPEHCATSVPMRFIGSNPLGLIRAPNARLLLRAEARPPSIMVLDTGFGRDDGVCPPFIEMLIEVNLQEARGEVGEDDDGNCYKDDVDGWNFALRPESSGVCTRSFHGTSMARLVSGPRRGTCRSCKLVLAVRPATRPYQDAHARAFYYARQREARIVSASFSAPSFSNDLGLVGDVFDRLEDQGVLVFVSFTRPGSFASHRRTVAVGASSIGDTVQCRTGCGPHLDVLAPAKLKGRFAGPSAATATTAGVAGLLLTLNPKLTPAEVREILRFTAEKIDFENAGYSDPIFGRSNTHGHGRINACRALSPVAKMAVETTPAGRFVVAKAISPFGLKSLELHAGVQVTKAPCPTTGVSCEARWKLTAKDGTKVAVDARVPSGALGQASKEYKRTAAKAEKFCEVELEQTLRERTRVLGQ